MNGKRIQKILRAEDGYALVAAMTIMMLMTALGLLAMVSSTSEQMITTNISQEQMIFYHAEQAIDRILSHMHYLEGGLFSNSNGLGFDPTQSGNTLSPIQVVNSSSGTYGRALFWDYSGSNKLRQSSQIFQFDAWVDPKDFEGTWDRGLSRPLIVNIRMTRKGLNQTEIQKSFRVYVEPKSVWDNSYYAGNYMPTERVNNTSIEACGSDSNSWYSCQTVFMNEDMVSGDLYISNTTYRASGGRVEGAPDTARLFVRGAPGLGGEVRWRGPESFDIGTYAGSTFNNSKNQTRGGRSTTAMPRAHLGMRAHSRPIMMPNMDILTTRNQGYWQAADIVLGSPGTGYAWKIIFRNDLDINNDGVRARSFVRSAITERSKAKSSPTKGSPSNEDRGVMVIYKVPYTSNDATTEQNYRRAAYFGGTMAERNTAMLAVAGERWSPTASFDGSISGDKCYGLRQNTSGTSTFGPYDTTDISPAYYFIYVPSRGMTKVGNNCSGGTYNGIIFVQGDVLVSGVLDGQVTIAAAGNIILDHEIEYENDPTTNLIMSEYANYLEPDILGLFATGNVVVPNSYPRKIAEANPPSIPFLDDWSDADFGSPENAGAMSNKRFQPTGNIRGEYTDDPAYSIEDDGNEDIHAVILSYAHQPCTVSGNSATCTEPTTADIQQFRTGFYAAARTINATWPTRPLVNDSPYVDSTTNQYSRSGNSSGQLRIVGAVIQNIPGRLAYDYVGSNWSSTCTTGSGCNRIGFSSIVYTYDKRLKYLMPPYPRLASQNYKTPYGMAAYDIISWEEIRTNFDPSQNIW